MNISIILDLVLTVQLSKPATECIIEFCSQIHEHPILLAVDENNPGFKLETLNSTFVVINEHYNLHFGSTSLRVNTGIIFLGCPMRNDSKILRTIKRNRLISVKMKLLLVVNVRCRSFAVSMDYLEKIGRILGPACAAVLAYNGIEENFSWAWSHGLKNQTSYSGSIDPKQCKIDIPDVKDFKGRDLKVSATPLEPYVMFPNSKGELTKGLEIKIIQNVVQALGMNLKWVTLPPNEPARLLQNEKNEYIGLFGVLDRLETDIGFGGAVYHLGRAFAAEMVTPHTQDLLVWLIPSAPEANNLTAIYSVFSVTMWMLVGISVLTFTAVFSCFRKNFAKNLMRTLGILLDQGVDVISHKYLHYWLLYILFCLIITNAYRSSLITALTSKKQASWFEKPEDAVDAGLMTFLSLSGMDLYKSTAVSDPMWRTILQPDRHQGIPDFSFLKNISQQWHGLVLCVRNPCQFSIYENSIVGQDMKPKVIFLEKRFQLFETSMFMAPGSVLLPAFDSQTHWLKAAGLVDYWLQEIEWRARLTALYSDERQYDGDGPQILTLQHLKSAFFIYAAFLFLSLFVFIIERLVFQRKQVTVHLRPRAPESALM